MAIMEEWPVDDQGGVTVTLRYPLMNGGLKTVRVRRPKAGDMRAVSNIDSDMARGLKLAEILSGLTTAQFDDLDVVDAGALLEVCQRMQSKSSR